MNYYNIQFGKLKRDGYYEYSRNTLSKYPIVDIDFENPILKNLHDKISNYVDQMLSSKKQFSNSKTENEKTYWEQKCRSIDNQIDRLVYELYGLTEEEIRIVEGKE